MEEANEPKELSWKKFRQSLQLTDEDGIIKRGNQEESVAMGMSHY